MSEIFLNERLKELRVKKNIEVKDLAEKVGIARSTYTGIETGHRDPSLKVIKRLAIELGTTTDYLQGLSDYPVSENSDSLHLQEALKHKTIHWDGRRISDEDLIRIQNVLEAYFSVTKE